MIDIANMYARALGGKSAGGGAADPVGACGHDNA
jgi:hypothetical protein